MADIRFLTVFFIICLKPSSLTANECENSLQCNVTTSWMKIFKIFNPNLEISTKYEPFYYSTFEQQQNQTTPDNVTTTPYDTVVESSTLPFENYSIPDFNNTDNSTEEEEPTFELEWSEVYEHIDLLQRLMFGFIIIFQIFTVAFFFNQFTERESEFKASYYVMLAVGMCSDILGHASELIQYYYFANEVGTEGYEALTYFLEFQVYHGAVFMVSMNVTFIFERVTEIWYKHLYSRIWNKTGTALILVANFILPLFVIGYILFQPQCVVYFTGCTEQLKVVPLILISYTFVAAFIMAIIVWKLFHRQKKGQKISHIDRAFIIESVIGLILLFIYQTCMTIWTFVWQFGYRNWDFYKPLEDFAIFSYLTLHVIEIYVLVTYPAFRDGMLKFYTGGYWKKNEVIVLMNKQQQA